MRRMTVKDFIDYGSPCLGCGKKMQLSIISLVKSNKDMALLATTIEGDRFTVNLKISYTDSLMMMVEPKTNKFAVTCSQTEFDKYMEDRMLMIATTCGHCISHFQSNEMKFNQKTGRIAPVLLQYEMIAVKTRKRKYQVTTIYKEGIAGNSELEVVDIEELKKMPPTMRVKLPFMPRYKFKGREHFLQKMQIYTTFS